MLENSTTPASSVAIPPRKNDNASVLTPLMVLSLVYPEYEPVALQSGEEMKGEK